jgi:hypothetical protein
VGFVVDKVALGQVFSEYFDFHQLLNMHHLSFGVGKIGKLMTDVTKWTQLRPNPRK